MASDGVYGTTPFDRVALYAQAILHDIDTEMPDAAYFTREDLLHIPCLSHISTISRYTYVCKAMRYCIDKGWILEGERNTLYLSGRKRAYMKAVTSWEAYIDTVTKLLPSRGTTFTVMSIVSKWDTDPHLTQNTKRAYVRQVIRRLVAQDVVDQSQFNIYERV